MRLYELGIYHHGCWNTNSIVEFPEIQSVEWGSRCVNRKVNSAVWKVNAPSAEQLEQYIRFLGEEKSVLEAKPLVKEEGNALVSICWKAEKTTYDSIMKSGSLYHSNTYSKDGYETYSVFSDEPGKMKKLIEEIEEIGEAKLFRIKRAEKSALLGNRFELTPKQMNALAFAVSQGYYSWPKKLNLEELAAKCGKKRRNLQEHIRKAEGKVLSKLLDELCNA